MKDEAIIDVLFDYYMEHTGTDSAAIQIINEVRGHMHLDKEDDMPESIDRLMLHAEKQGFCKGFTMAIRIMKEADAPLFN